MFRNQLGKLQTLWAKCKILKVQGPLCTTLKVCGPNYKIETSRTRLKIYDRGTLKVILLTRSLSSEFDRSFQTALTNEGGSTLRFVIVDLIGGFQKSSSSKSSISCLAPSRDKVVY